MPAETNDSTKEQNKTSAVEYNEPQPSDDDDDFPDEQEIFQANGLLKLQKTISVPVSSMFSRKRIFFDVALSSDQLSFDHHFLLRLIPINMQLSIPRLVLQ